MTDDELRDEFAGRAMQVILDALFRGMKPGDWTAVCRDPMEIAKFAVNAIPPTAYKMADAMMAERAKRMKTRAEKQETKG